MRIVSARWTSWVNMLVLQCACAAVWEHRADRWRVRCPRCHACEHLSALRERYLAEHSTGALPK